MNLLAVLQMRSATPIWQIERIFDISARLITVKTVEKTIAGITFKYLKHLTSANIIFFPTHLGYVVFKEEDLDRDYFAARPISIDGYSLFKRFCNLERCLHNVGHDTDVKRIDFLKHDPAFEMTAADALILSWGFEQSDLINAEFDINVSNSCFQMVAKDRASMIEFSMNDSTDIKISYL